MKNLNKYIQESILDDEDDLMDDMGDEILIKGFLEENYVFSDEWTLKDGIVSSIGYVMLKPSSPIKHLTNGAFKFGIVNGVFDCSGSEIVDLVGSPTYVGKNFICTDCKDLETLEGCTQTVGKNFNCSGCLKLKSLKGGPRTLKWAYSSYSCRNCTELTSLTGAPAKVPGRFDCEGCTSLTSLKGGPKNVGNMSCVGCASLIDIKNAPKYKYSFDLIGTPAYEKYNENK